MGKLSLDGTKVFMCGDRVCQNKCVAHQKHADSCKRRGSDGAQGGNDGEDGEMKSRYCLHLHVSSAGCLGGYGRWLWHRSVERLEGER